MSGKALPVADCAKPVIYISAAAAVVLVFVAGAGDVSRPPGRDLAIHWQAGERTDRQMQPDKLFVIICDADKGSHIRSLQHLTSLRAAFLANPREWEQGNERYACISKGSFRLGRPSGAFGGPYDEQDKAFRQDVSFRVLQEDAARQVVEVRYNDSMADIVDSLFVYEIRGSEVYPLESRVLPRIKIGMLGMTLVVVAATLLWPLCGGLVTLFRSIRSRQRR